MNRQVVLVLALSALWGACATWILWWLVALVSGALLEISSPTVSRAIASGWTTDQIRPYLHIIMNVLPPLLYGLLFGLPIGLLTRFVVGSCLAFMVAFLLVMVGRMMFDDLDFGTFVEYIAHPMYIGTVLATLLFAVLGNRLRFVYEHRRAA